MAENAPRRPWWRRFAVLDETVDRSLAEIGLRPADVARSRRGSTNQVAGMMAHFGIDPERTPPRYWGALRDAERVCAHCREAGRCQSWFEANDKTDAPRLFCPNAALYDEIVADLRPSADEPER